MTDIYVQIQAHPKFPELSEGTRFAFAAAVNGWSHRVRENNKYCRQIWDHLYLGKPMP